MELDARIRSLDDVLTCFNIEKAKQFIGQMGYFAGDLYCFSDIEQLCPYDKLVNVFDQDDAFYRGDITFPFFIPECFLKPAEKTYRPFTLSEFTEKFPVGQPIKFRQKRAVGYERYLILNGYQHEQAEGRLITYIYMGSQGYTLDALFMDYEWQEADTGDWMPFGVEE